MDFPDVHVCSSSLFLRLPGRRAAGGSRASSGCGGGVTKSKDDSPSPAARVSSCCTWRCMASHGKLFLAPSEPRGSFAGVAAKRGSMMTPTKTFLGS